MRLPLNIDSSNFSAMPGLELLERLLNLLLLSWLKAAIIPVNEVRAPRCGELFFDYFDCHV